MPKKPYKTWGIKHTRIPITPELLASEEGRKLLQKALNPPKIEEMLDELEAKAKKVLRNYKLDENWTAHIGTSPETLPEQAFHCIEILSRMERVRLWLHENNARMAATETIHMMNAVTDSILTHMEPDIYRGKMLLEKASIGGKQANHYNAARHRAWQREAEKIWKKEPALSAREVAEMIAQQMGKSPETIRRHIKRPK